ncbi:unnamed protein product [Camellia sinensis]
MGIALPCDDCTRNYFFRRGLFLVGVQVFIAFIIITETKAQMDKNDQGRNCDISSLFLCMYISSLNVLLQDGVNILAVNYDSPGACPYPWQLKLAVINYGASWCRVCSQILPSFCQLSNKFPKLSFVYADIDECPETTQHIRYTPTFHFYRDGERVDEMFGAGEERLQDRLWLHS